MIGWIICAYCALHDSCNMVFHTVLDIDGYKTLAASTSAAEWSKSHAKSLLQSNIIPGYYHTNSASAIYRFQMIGLSGDWHSFAPLPYIGSEWLIYQETGIALHHCQGTWCICLWFSLSGYWFCWWFVRSLVQILVTQSNQMSLVASYQPVSWLNCIPWWC